MMKYNEDLANAGVLLSLDGLKPPSAGVRVSYSGGKPKVTDGPFAEAKECVGGYWMIQVKSKEEAIEWAKRAPMSDNEIIEVRQVHEMEDFPADVQAAAAGFEELQDEITAQFQKFQGSRVPWFGSVGFRFGTLVTQQNVALELWNPGTDNSKRSDRRGLEDRIAEADRRAGAHDARRRPRRRSRAGCAGRRRSSSGRPKASRAIPARG